MVNLDNTLSEDCLVKSYWWFDVDNILFTTLTCSPNRYPRHAYWGSDGKQTGQPGHGQGGVVASVRGNESRNAPGLPSSEARGAPVARSGRRQAARIGRTARRPGSYPGGPKGASPEAAVGAPSSGQARVAFRSQGPPRATESTVRDPGSRRRAWAESQCPRRSRARPHRL